MSPKLISHGVGGACAVIFGWWLGVAYNLMLSPEVTAAFASMFSLVLAGLEALFDRIFPPKPATAAPGPVPAPAPLIQTEVKP